MSSKNQILTSYGTGLSNHRVHNLGSPLNFHHKPRTSSFPTVKTELRQNDVVFSGLTLPPLIYSKPDVDENKQTENQITHQSKKKNDDVASKNVDRPALAEQSHILPPISLPREAASGSTRASLAQPRSSFTKATMPRPSLTSLLNSSVNVSQLPRLSKENATEWVCPAKDHLPKQPNKVKILTWSDLTINHLDQLNECKSADCLKDKLAEIFRLDNYENNIKYCIIIDLYFHTLQFARMQEFTKEKTSTVFSIVKRVFESCTGTSFNNLDDTFKFFKKLLIAHSVERPPFSIEIFSTLDVERISEHVVNTFFKHFQMYKHAFTPQVRLDLDIGYTPKDKVDSKCKLCSSSPPRKMKEKVLKAKEKDAALETDISTENSRDKQKELEKIRLQKRLERFERQRLLMKKLMKEAKTIEGSLVKKGFIWERR